MFKILSKEESAELCLEEIQAQKKEMESTMEEAHNEQTKLAARFIDAFMLKFSEWYAQYLEKSVDLPFFVEIGGHPDFPNCDDSVVLVARDILQNELTPLGMHIVGCGKRESEKYPGHWKTILRIVKQ